MKNGEKDKTFVNKGGGFWPALKLFANINLFLSKHQHIKGIKGVSEGGKGVAKLLFSGLGRA